MRTKYWLLISLLTLLAVLTVYAQSGPLKATIPFAFSAAGKQFPAGQYEITRSSSAQAFDIKSGDRKSAAVVLIFTRTAGVIHNTPADAHIVFDRVGESYTLAELWFPGADGYIVNMMKEQHQHRVVDVPAK
jgi:hypothetical protein